MKRSSYNFLTTIALLIAASLSGQNQASKELDGIIGLPLLSAHKELLNNGYEIAHSSLFNKKQLWYNESKGDCISFTFANEGENLVESISPGKEKKCIRGVRAARKVWANYRDGGAPDSFSALDRERETLTQQGFKVTYWINDVSPGKTAEVWFNEAEQSCKMVSWEIKSKSNIKIQDRDPRLGTNPAPIYDTHGM